MTSTILPVSLAAQASSSSSSSDSRTSVSSTDFMKILLAQMSSPDLSSLFGSNNNESSSSSSIFGSSMDSLFGSNTSLLTQALSGTGSSALGPFTTPQMELSVWSNLIGKTVYSTDPITGAAVSGVVKSVLLQNSSTVLDIGDKTIKPSTITKVS